MSAVTVSLRHSPVLDMFLALHRDLIGRCSWEVNLLPRPVEPGIAAFKSGLAAWRQAGLPIPAAFLGRARNLDALTGEVADPVIQAAVALVAGAIKAAQPWLDPALAALREHREAAIADLPGRLRLAEVADPLAAAMGMSGDPIDLPVYLVPYAPYPPAAGFLLDGPHVVGAYVDCRRYVGGILAESVLTQLAWAILRERSGSGTLWTLVCTLLPGDEPYLRRLRLLLVKVLVEMTAGHLVRRVEPSHRRSVDVLGTAWRYPRLYDLARRHWDRYLDGLCDREEALAAIVAQAATIHPSWYVDSVDGASLAADFYLLEWLTAEGDAAAGVRLAEWLPQLSREFAGHLDLIIGTELGHFERAHRNDLPAELSEFVGRVTDGDSRFAWWRARREMGEAAGLAAAVAAFAGPGVEYGGEAWAPIARMLRRFVIGDLPQQVFVDQCFTLQHNNGCLFDKYFEAEHLPAVLDAQAAGDLTALAGYASAEVRELFWTNRRRAHAGYSPAWLGAQPAAPQSDLPARYVDQSTALGSAPLGGVGCGTSQDPNSKEPMPVDIRRRTWRFRRPWPSPPRYFDRATAALHTSVGIIRLQLWPHLVPATVDNFVALAEGSRPWRDQRTGQVHRTPYYDRTTFYRRIPGFVIEAGDRSETGSGGPGYRIPDELPDISTFGRPFLLAMANSGRDSAGSRFFITLVPAPHLDGAYQVFGDVADDTSCGVAVDVAASTEPVLLERVDVDAA